MARDLLNPAERHPEKARVAESPRLPKPDWIHTLPSRPWVQRIRPTACNTDRGAGLRQMR